MTTDNIGGVWSFSLDLAAELEKRGHEVHLAVVGPEPSKDQRDELQGLTVAWDHHAARLEWMGDPWDDVAATGAWLREVARRVQPDLIHLNEFSHALLSWELPVVVVAHSDVVTWWRAVHGREPPEEWDRYRSVVAQALDAADAVVAPTHAMLDALQGSYSFSTRAHVVSNAVPSGVEPRWEKEQLVVAAGRIWDRAKNVAMVARVADRLNWPVAIAGAGSPTAGETRWLGHLRRDDLRALFERVAIFVEPAFYEPFGLTALEAGARGCALVLGDIASFREIWGDAAVFVDPRDEVALCETVNSLIEDEPRRLALARKARARALQYRIDKTTDGYLSIYDNIVGPSDTRRGRVA